MAPTDRTSSLSEPGEVAQKGDQIYNEKYRGQFEKEHLGKFVVIDVLTGKAYIADYPEQAIEQARGDAPDGVFHLIRVGSPGAFKVSYTSSHASRPRPF